MKYLKQFNQRLKKLREQKRLSIQEVASFCLVDESVVESWEAEQSEARCYPSLANLLDLSFKTGVALDSFVDMPIQASDKQLVLPGLNLGEEADLSDSLHELGERIEKLIPTKDEQTLLRRYRKSDAQTKELILQLIVD